MPLCVRCVFCHYLQTSQLPLLFPSSWHATERLLHAAMKLAHQILRQRMPTGGAQHHVPPCRPCCSPQAPGGRACACCCCYGSGGGVGYSAPQIQLAYPATTSGAPVMHPCSSLGSAVALGHPLPLGAAVPHQQRSIQCRGLCIEVCAVPLQPQRPAGIGSQATRQLTPRL